jgi:nitrogen PTS system EIIA component
MQLADILKPSAVACNVVVKSKKSVLEQLAGLVAVSVPGHALPEIFNSLITRERLGSTGIGRGVAIPHGRLSHTSQIHGAFIHTQIGIDFNAPDGQSVDLFFALLVPEQAVGEHLQILAELAERFHNDNYLARLRACHSETELFALLVAPQGNGQ